MGRKDEDLKPLSEMQLEIMDVVWDRGEATLSDVWGAVSEKRAVARNTVQTLLTRMVEKGWLTYRAEGKTFHYRSTKAREETLKGVLKRLLDSAFKGSTEGLVMTLLQDQKLDPEEAARIRALIEKAEAEEK